MQIYVEKTGPDFFLSSLESYLLDERFADGEIVAQGRRFPIHRPLLATISPFLAPDLWSSDLIVLPETSVEALEAFLRLLYSGQTGTIHPETHYELSRLLRSIQATKIVDVPLLELKPRKESRKRPRPSAQITKRPSTTKEVELSCEMDSDPFIPLTEDEFSNALEEPKKPERKLVTKTYQEKYDIIKFYEAHPEMKKVELAKMFGLPRGTMSEILKHRHKIIDTVENSITRKPLTKRVKAVSYDCVDSALISWYHQETLITDVRITRDILLQKARSLAAEFGLEEANKISRSWIERFKSRYGLTRPPKPSVPHVESHTVEISVIQSDTSLC
ncbi:uncharacterized protein [Lepeophtheirus salmonis]|uniref:uncharacterized protein n=1 Tax=Lepeophtheirus salmonis TaxID=72036 RepID=UPI001AE9E929|nr:uncharacterized protein LOC121120502 [Lepeophtheirus salmonis]